MIRTLSLPLIALLPFICAAHAAPVLKPSVVVTSGIVTLGDLISDAGANASQPAFRAPDPGANGEVSVQDVLDAARRAGIVDIETSGLASIRVARTGRRVSEDEIRVPLITALAAQIGSSNPADIGVQINDSSKSLHLPIEAHGLVSVDSVSWDRTLGTFDAVLRIARTDGTDETRGVNGKAFETESVVTLVRAVERGAILSNADIEIGYRPKSITKMDALSSPEAAVGMQARRAMREGQALRDTDLEQPLLIKSGAQVAIVLRSGNMTLTATVQALRDGRMGDTIQVVNVQSKRTLQAVVTGPNQVSIHTPRTLVSASK